MTDMTTNVLGSDDWMDGTCLLIHYSGARCPFPRHQPSALAHIRASICQWTVKRAVVFLPLRSFPRGRLPYSSDLSITQPLSSISSTKPQYIMTTPDEAIIPLKQEKVEEVVKDGKDEQKGLSDDAYVQRSICSDVLCYACVQNYRCGRCFVLLREKHSQRCPADQYTKL